MARPLAFGIAIRLPPPAYTHEDAAAHQSRRQIVWCRARIDAVRHAVEQLGCPSSAVKRPTSAATGVFLFV